MTMCVHVHVWWGIKVTNDFCVTQYSRHCPHAYEGTVYAVGHSLFLNTLSSLDFCGPQKPLVSLPPQRGFLFFLCPDSKCWKDPRAQF